MVALPRRTKCYVLRTVGPDGKPRRGDRDGRARRRRGDGGRRRGMGHGGMVIMACTHGGSNVDQGGLQALRASLLQGAGSAIFIFVEPVLLFYFVHLLMN